MMGTFCQIKKILSYHLSKLSHWNRNQISDNLEKVGYTEQTKVEREQQGPTLPIKSPTDNLHEEETKVIISNSCILEYEFL